MIKCDLLGDNLPDRVIMPSVSEYIRTTSASRALLCVSMIAVYCVLSTLFVFAVLVATCIDLVLVTVTKDELLDGDATCKVLMKRNECG